MYKRIVCPFICLIFLVLCLLLSLHHLLNSPRFVVLNDFEPLFCEWLVLKDKVPLKTGQLSFLIFHSKLYLQLIRVWRTIYYWNIDVSKLILRLRYFCFKGNLFGLIDVVEHSCISIENQQPLILKHRNLCLTFICIRVVYSLTVYSLLMYRLLHLRFCYFHSFLFKLYSILRLVPKKRLFLIYNS